jgi:hypothetical protein
MLFALILAATPPVSYGALDTWPRERFGHGDIAFSGDGKRVARGDSDDVEVVDVSSGKTVRALAARCNHVALSRDGARLFCGGERWEVARGARVDDDPPDTVVIRAHPAPRASILAADGVTALYLDGPVQLKTAGGLMVKLAVPTQGRAAMWRSNSRISDDGRVVAVPSEEGISLFSGRTGAFAGVVAKDMGFVPFAVAAGVVAVAAPTGVVLYDPKSARERRRVPLQERAESLALSADGRVLVAIHSGTALVVDVASGEVLRSLPIRSRSALDRIALSGDGALLAVAPYDAALRVVSTKDGATLAWPRRHAGPVRAAAFSPDGARVATSAEDGVRIWSAADGALVHFEPAVSGSALRMTSARDVVVAGTGAARLVEDARGAWTRTGSSEASGATTAYVATDGKSAWITRETGENVERVAVDTGASLEQVRIRYAGVFAADDAGRVAVTPYPGDALKVGPPSEPTIVFVEGAPTRDDAGRGTVVLSDDGVHLFMHFEHDGAGPGHLVSTTDHTSLPVAGAAALFIAGGRLATSDGKLVHLYDVASGKELASGPQPSGVLLAASADGAKLAFGVRGQLVVIDTPR